MRCGKVFACQPQPTLGVLVPVLLVEVLLGGRGGGQRLRFWVPSALGRNTITTAARSIKNGVAVFLLSVCSISIPTKHTKQRPEMARASLKGSAHNSKQQHTTRRPSDLWRGNAASSAHRAQPPSRTATARAAQRHLQLSQKTFVVLVPRRYTTK